jgi:hypothetical protein
MPVNAPEAAVSGKVIVTVPLFAALVTAAQNS